jgi:hypothetical protein
MVRVREGFITIEERLDLRSCLSLYSSESAATWNWRKGTLWRYWINIGRIPFDEERLRCQVRLSLRCVEFHAHVKFLAICYANVVVWFSQRNGINADQQLSW